jgi:hypothetical protein
MRLRSRDLFQTVHTEGGLLPADLLQRVADGDRALEGLKPTDYHLDPGERLGERITRAWTRLTSVWAVFDDARQQLPPADAAGALTRDRWLQIVFDELGYGRLVQQPPIQIDEKPYPIFTQWQNTPIHLVGAGVTLDRRTAGVRGAAVQSPHGLVQELLNRSPERLWGLVSNGLLLRVLRDNVSLTRQAYIEFDLEAMFTGEVYSDFVLLWLVCHQSRVEASKAEDCWLELWTRAAVDSGTRALEALRHGVEAAIEQLGAGFLAHAANQDLHDQLRSGQVEPLDYYRALLRLVYRLLFLFVAEDRNALLDPNGDAIAKRRYVDYYSTAHLRDLASKRRGSRHHDRYEQLKLVMNALNEHGSQPLALPALGSYLWEPAAIGLLADAQLANEDLFHAVRSLATVEQDNVRRSVDFRNLGAEELGSVYESLLELHPTVNRDTREFTLEAVTGSERKTTGSYYTPTSLISSLLDTALDPVLDEAARSENPETAILSLAVVDPACGSGHFLIAAANRIAKRLAAVRSDAPEPSPIETRAALRDVIGHCIHGVDMNPMAVELCKVSLWMEALEPGRPLSFLDHRIVLGNSLLGATPELIAAGIPPDAFKPILGDERKYASALRKRNDAERAGQLTLDLGGERVDSDIQALAGRAVALDMVDDHSLAGVREQQKRFQQLLYSVELQRARLAADTWCAAFVAPKREGWQPITQDTLDRVISRDVAELSPDEMSVITEMKVAYSFLHWHVAFPAVWEKGGFDVVLGNPPWERVKLQEQEFFAARSADIATAPNKAARERLIANLATEDADLLKAFEAAKREAEGASHLIRNSGRYPLCGRGDVNTYSIFAELMHDVLSDKGRVGVVVPTGIATDSTTQYFFRSLSDSRSLGSLFDFQNVDIFPGVGHGVMHFCLLTMNGAARPALEPLFSFGLKKVEELDDPTRRFTLTAEDIALLNPNTRTCPVFRTRRDAEITKAIYRGVPVLVREGDPNGNAWDVKFSRMFDMSNDSGLFRTRDELEAEGATPDGSTFVRGDERWLPLYEAKMLHHYDHRWATYEGVDTRGLTPVEKADPRLLAYPRYWVRTEEVDAQLPHWGQNWLVGFRDIARNTDERTVIAGFFPRTAAGNKLPELMLGVDARRAAAAVASLCSFVHDYAARQKVGGTTLNFFLVNQFPMPAPTTFGQGTLDFIVPRVLELTYTAFDLVGLAADLGYQGPPFRWDTDRRALIRAELDAMLFRVYGLERADVDYVMETFPIVKSRDEERLGEYRTKRLILERYDAMVTAEVTGVPYETTLDPPPGDPRAAHPPVRPTAPV